MENQIQDLLGKLNENFRTQGMPELLYVDPVNILPQEKNARYFKPEVFQQLVENIKSDGYLESVPLVYRFGEKFKAISGHHRVKGAVEAGLPNILVFCIQPQNRDVIIQKQLAHNSLVGEDDKIILKELFYEIQNLELRFASGLNSEIEKIDYSSLNFRIGDFKDIILLFLPEQIQEYDSGLEDIINNSSIKSSSQVRIASIEYYDKFVSVLSRLKKNDNIKNNAAAILRMIDITNQYLKLHKDTE